jgi:dienelactone hydrolase
MKRFGAMLWLIIGILITNAVPAHAATWEDATGPYPIAVVADTGPENGYDIYRPQILTTNTHPIAVFCVGSGSHPRDYAHLLNSLASHGVVVIASTSPYQFDGSKASTGVDWLIEQNEIGTSEYLKKLIPSRAMAIGHSNGGNGAMMASRQNAKITSLLLYAPATDNASAADLIVPTFFVSGSLDTIIYPSAVKAKYLEATKTNAWYGENANQGHAGFGRNPSVQHYTRAWVYTHLFDDSGTARGAFYGPNWTFKDASTWKETLKNNSAL